MAGVKTFRREAYVLGTRVQLHQDDVGWYFVDVREVPAFTCPVRWETPLLCLMSFMTGEFGRALADVYREEEQGVDDDVVDLGPAEMSHHSSCRGGEALGGVFLVCGLSVCQMWSIWYDRWRAGDVTVVVTWGRQHFFPVAYVRGRRGVLHLPPIPQESCRVGLGGFSVREVVMGLISQALGAAANSTAGRPAEDKAMAKDAPTLHAFMTTIEEDGQVRQPSSLTVFTEDGIWKGVLSEKDRDLKLWRSGESFNKLIAALEKALASGQADWRPGTRPAQRGGPRKGK